MHCGSQVYKQPGFLQVFVVEDPKATYLTGQHDKPSIPTNISLHKYQYEAYENWERNGYQGILSMATGTGKTITALASLTLFYQQKKNVFALVTCPYL